jgi:predicted O-methyltransferase YrrM
MNSYIRSIYESKRVVGKSGLEIALHSEIDPSEGAFIHRVITEDTGITKTLEVGCAYGLSSLHICDALGSRPGARHFIIDPFQASQWDGVGVRNLEKAGISFFTLIENKSEIALPELLDQGEATFDLIFIDGWHTFDHTLLDCFYATRLLRQGGYLLIDDVGMPAVRRTIDYLIRYPCYQTHATLSVPRPLTLKRRAAMTALGCIGSEMRSRLFHPEWLNRAFDDQFTRMIALKKISEDRRSWDWFPSGF